MSGRRAGTGIVFALAALAAVSSQAHANDRAPIRRLEIPERPAYDIRLEQAAMRIVANRIGDLRGMVDETALIPLVEAVRMEEPVPVPGFVVLAGAGEGDG